VRSRLGPAAVNEVLAKVLCHNLACVILAWYEMGIDPRAFYMPGPKAEGQDEPSRDAPAILRFPGNPVRKPGETPLN
jgi:hypothetical protein